MPSKPKHPTVTRPITDLLPDPNNARRHGPKNLDAIRASLRRFGQVKPLVLDRDGVVVAGNGTLIAMNEEGFTHVDCIVYDGDAAEARAYAIADNQTAILAEWDYGVLAAQLTSFDVDLMSSAGFDQNDLDKIFAMLEDTPGQVGDASSDVMADVFGVIVSCATEAQQRDLMDKLELEGFTVRAMIQ